MEKFVDHRLKHLVPELKAGLEQAQRDNATLKREAQGAQAALEKQLQVAKVDAQAAQADLQKQLKKELQEGKDARDKATADAQAALAAVQKELQAAQAAVAALEKELQEAQSSCLPRLFGGGRSNRVAAARAPS